MSEHEHEYEIKATYKIKNFDWFIVVTLKCGCGAEVWDVGELTE